MDNQGIYVGLDIGTTSIKVIVAEAVQGQMNVIGVGSQRSEGVSRGVIVDIDKAVAVVQAAVAQAEDKANIKIDRVVAGIPANMLQIEQVSGMIAVGEENKEISDKDVRSVAAAALVRNLSVKHYRWFQPNLSLMALMTLKIHVGCWVFGWRCAVLC